MTIAAHVEALIQRSESVAICEDCITDKLNLPVRSHVNVVTPGLAARAVTSATNDPADSAMRSRRRYRIAADAIGERAPPPTTP